MKDYVFIGWSRNRDLAIELKKLLDANGFVGVIGGVYEENPENLRIRKGTVNETINYQMNHCDQSILLFQKIDDNLGISGNLIYELGYISAQYNFIETATKLHIFKIDITQADDNLFPSDLHGVWGSNISSVGKTLPEIAEEIMAEFIKSQLQIKKENKFMLLNDHHFVEYELRKHFKNPTMSDYDLAQDILIYLQSAFCYQEQNDVKTKIEHFKNKMIENSSHTRELKWAVDYALVTLELFCQTIPTEEGMFLRMPGVMFRRLLNSYKEIGERVAESFEDDFPDTDLKRLTLTDAFFEKNEFEGLLIAQMQEHVTYLILVYLFNSTVDKEEMENYVRLGIEYCNIAIKNLELVGKIPENDMYSKVLLSYAYKNLSTFHGYLGNAAENKKYQRKSFKLRRDLNTYASGISVIRPSLKDYITLEYLLQSVEVAKESEDKFERGDYLHEIKVYLDQRQKTERTRNFLLYSLIDEYGKLLGEGNENK